MYWLAIRYLLAVSIGLLAGWTVQGWRKSAEIQSLKTQAAEKEAQAVSKALDLTRQASQKTQRIIDRQRDEIKTLNIGLERTLGELRQRPARLPDPPAACQGTTGAELSRQDAEFLAREAARADKLRISLETCYQQYEANYANRVN